MSSPEMKAFFLTLSNQEEQNLENIRRGLLATLAEYHGFAKIKKLFEEALNSVDGSGSVEVVENVVI